MKPLFLCFALVPACAPMDETARAKFSAAAVCPESRIDIDEVESPSRTIYVAHGCGEERRYTCWHPRRNHVFTTKCEELAPGAPVPVRVTRWGTE
jgi:hypothetical protein